jgi:hypothetical protein
VKNKNTTGKHNIKILQPEVCFIALFLVFALIFISFRAKFADYAAWLLAMTHEISIAPAKTNQAKDQGSQGQTQVQPQEQQAPIKISALAQIPAPKNKVAERINPAVKKNPEISDKPVKANLPKTDIPAIFHTIGVPDWSRPDFAPFPPLRKFDGTAWDEEKTEIRIATDGKTLYVLYRAYDKNPGEAIIGDSKTRKVKGLWDTDSFELFLMKSGNSDYYCQYISSVNGKGKTCYNKIASKPNSYQSVTPPKSFKFPRFSAEEFDWGFELEIKIALSNIDVDTLKVGDSLLMQIVRNYRGQAEKTSVTLQLFPVYIYADSRPGINNHDRRAFQAVPVKRDK